jgi:hypothetical protein
VESKEGSLLHDCDRHLMLQFRGSVVASNAGLFSFQELNDVFGLTVTLAEAQIAGLSSSKMARDDPRALDVHSPMGLAAHGR